MYKILNKLFGYDYVGWNNSAASGVARVFLDGTGRCFYFRYKATHVIDEVKTHDQVVWLTCNPDKYLNGK